MRLAWLILLLATPLAFAQDPSKTLPEAILPATHNSYAPGKGSIIHQLDGGVRFIEFDLHDVDFTTRHDYALGHDRPGDQLAVGSGNPTTENLADWLAVLRDWSKRHAGHMPIVLGLDIKRDPHDESPIDAARLDFLDRSLAQSFGDALFPSTKIKDAWPKLPDMKGRVLIVLSGDLKTRLAYLKRDKPIAFVEFQKGNDAQLAGQKLWFYAARAVSQSKEHPDENIAWALRQRRAGKIVRLWQFNAISDAIRNAPIAPANFPATDQPDATWYTLYLKALEARK